MVKKLLLFSLILSMSLSSAIAQTEGTEKEAQNIEGAKKTRKQDNLGTRIDEWFKPKVNAMASILFWDPLQAMGIYDPVVYQEDGSPFLEIDRQVIYHEEAIPFNTDSLRIFIHQGKKKYLINRDRGIFYKNGNVFPILEEDSYVKINFIINADGNVIIEDKPAFRINGDPYKLEDLAVLDNGKNNICLVHTHQMFYNTDGTQHPVSKTINEMRHNKSEYVLATPLEKHFPFVVIWLVLGAIFFTIRMKFINVRGFRHSLDLVRGKFDNPDDPGEVSHFQALATAVSGTVGLGNIAGVAIAISVGGPGATFWMIIAGLLGMSLKFTEVTLGVKYRVIDEDGVVSGGPMYYLSNALKKKNLKWLGKILAIVFSIILIGASLGGGNMFQANQTYQQIELLIPSLAGHGAFFGIGMAILVGMVIVGGIKSIAKVTEKVVPIMAGIYILAALFIIGYNFTDIPKVFGLIINGAFGPEAIRGGFIGVLIVGFQRASFSNEAGGGSASIAHSAVKTEEPVSEGIVALLEPFIDTVIVCTMTALVIIFTGYHDPALAQHYDGAQLTSKAFGSVISWFPYILGVSIALFAFSTMVSWSYYGLKGFTYLFGSSFDKVFKNKNIKRYAFFAIYLFFVVVGAAANLGSVMDFADMMILSLAFPNIIGLLILAPEVVKDLKSYMARVKSGEIKKYK